ncbi:MAG: hypothetical protein HYZ53_26670 [Planctomycetes bacterium]|nr:hypothetical protein [Planctomycetota bacterium]
MADAAQPPNEDSLFGQIALANKLLPKARIDECLRIQAKMKSLGISKRLGEIFLEKGLLPPKTIQAIVEVQRKRLEQPVPELEPHSLSDKEHEVLLKIVTDRKLVSGEHLSECLDLQAKLDKLGVPRRLGELLLDKGYIEPSVVEEMHELEERVLRDAQRKRKAGRIDKVDAAFGNQMQSRGWIPPDRLDELRGIQRQLAEMDIYMSLDDLALAKGWLNLEQTTMFRASALAQPGSELGEALGGPRARAAEGVFLGELLVAEGLLSGGQVNACLDAQQKMEELGIRLPLGEIAVAKGMLPESEVPRLLVLQRKRRLRSLQGAFVTAAGWAAAALFALIALAFAGGVFHQLSGAPDELTVQNLATADAPRDSTEAYLSPPRHVKPGAGRKSAEAGGTENRGAGAGGAAGAARVPGAAPRTEDPATQRANEAKRAKEAEAARAKAEAEARARAEAAKAGEAQKERERAASQLDEVLAETDAFVRTFRYKKALDEYARLRAGVERWQDLAARVDARSAEVKRLADLHERLKTAIRDKALRDSTLRYGPALEYKAAIDSASDDGFQVTFQGGSSTLHWVQMKPVQMFELLERMELSVDDLFTVSGFCLDNGLLGEAHKLLIEVAKREPAQRQARDAFLASRLGLAIPGGGFVAWQGRLVSPEEKANREKGLLPWAGGWITRDELVQYAQKGFVKQGGKWIPKGEADLLAQGYRKYKDKWYTRDELATIRANWEDAWELETEHYAIRTNTSEEFQNELAAILEAAYAVEKEVFEKEPGGKKMNIYAFRTFEDFRNFCIQEKQEGSLRAHGFAIAARNYGCGYDALKTKDSFLSTMVHEGCHLFYGRSNPASDAPSWYHEGMATNFEGYTWDGKKLTFTFISPWRLPWVKPAFKSGNYLPLAEFLDGDAGAAINKGVQDSTVFYSQAWALYYFLGHTPNPDLKVKWQKLKQKYDSGASRGTPTSPAGFFRSVFGEDLDVVEQAWKEFILGL